MYYLREYTTKTAYKADNTREYATVSTILNDGGDEKVRFLQKIADDESNLPLMNLARAANWVKSTATCLTNEDAERVTEIPTSARLNRIKQTLVNFDEFAYFTSMETINEGAFSGCTSLTSIIIPNSSHTIETRAFENCTSLTTITIPESIETIEPDAFLNCASLSTLYINSRVLMSKDYDRETNITQMFDGARITTVVLGSSIDTIGEYMFSECTTLSSITLPQTLTTIRYRAFRRCSSLESIDLPNSLTSLGEINSSIGEEDFNGGEVFANSGLRSIVIPDQITTILDHMFDSCGSLVSVTMSNNVTSIDGSAFYNCSRLSSVRISDNLTTLGMNVFYGCSSLSSVTIPNSVTSIGEGAFAFCNGLTSVTIGNSVALIGKSAFNNCSSLDRITSSATTAPTISDSTFMGVKPNGALYRPFGSDYSGWMSNSDYYLGSYGWSERDIV